MHDDWTGRERGPDHDLCIPRLSDAERRAVQTHRYFLSERAGYDVGDEAATQDWLRHHSRRWREERCREDARAQHDQIQCHKWIESEKAGRDLGEDAVVDWIRRFAASWRMHREMG
jgi:hypothetical protein